MPGSRIRTEDLTDATKARSMYKTGANESLRAVLFASTDSVEWAFDKTFSTVIKNIGGFPLEVPLEPGTEIWVRGSGASAWLVLTEDPDTTLLKAILAELQTLNHRVGTR